MSSAAVNKEKALRLDKAEKISKTVVNSRTTRLMVAPQSKDWLSDLVHWNEVAEKNRAERTAAFEQLVPRKCRGFQAYDINIVYFDL